MCHRQGQHGLWEGLASHNQQKTCNPSPASKTHSDVAAIIALFSVVAVSEEIVFDVFLFWNQQRGQHRRDQS